LRCAPRNNNRSRYIPNTEWSFASRPQGGNLKVNHTQIVIRLLFKPARLYKVIYRATDPLVFAWALRPRDLDGFLKAAQMTAAAIRY
jgi:hypothetical protein